MRNGVAEQRRNDILVRIRRLSQSKMARQADLGR
jgi:hypothetical protein